MLHPEGERQMLGFERKRAGADVLITMINGTGLYAGAGRSNLQMHSSPLNLRAPVWDWRLADRSFESRGGRLWATCDNRPGATFHFTLPIEATAHQAA
jgi:hypothetical protein